MHSIAFAPNQYYIVQHQEWSNLHYIQKKEKSFVTKDILHQALLTMLIPLTYWSMKVFFPFDT